MKEAGSQTVVDRSRVLAFDATTGKIDDGFKPAVDGEVSALLPAADGKSIYLGGMFTHIDGVAHKVLARLDINTGQAVAGFTPNVDARVKDLRLAGGRLWVGGQLRPGRRGGADRAGDAQPQHRPARRLPSLPSPERRTAARRSSTRWTSPRTAPSWSAVGNFPTVGGQSRPQIVMLDLTGSTARLANWQTSRYAADCSVGVRLVHA